MTVLVFPVFGFYHKKAQQNATPFVVDYAVTHWVPYQLR